MIPLLVGFGLGFIAGGFVMAYSSKDWLTDLRKALNDNDRLTKQNHDLALENVLWECAVRTRDAMSRRMNTLLLSKNPKQAARN